MVLVCAAGVVALYFVGLVSEAVAGLAVLFLLVVSVVIGRQTRSGSLSKAALQLATPDKDLPIPLSPEPSELDPGTAPLPELLVDETGTALASEPPVDDPGTVLVPPVDESSTAAESQAAEPAGFIPRVFISHSSADNEFGIKLARALQSALGE